MCLQCGRLRFDPWVRKIPWRREQLPTAVFWPGEFHGQRSLVGYSSQGRKESNTTEQLMLNINRSEKLNMAPKRIPLTKFGNIEVW